MLVFHKLSEASEVFLNSLALQFDNDFHLLHDVHYLGHRSFAMLHYLSI